MEAKMKFVFLTTESINKFMALALTRGISHWCGAITVSMAFRGWLSDALSAGHEVWLTEAKAEEAYLLTLDKLCAGMELYAEKLGMPLAEHSLDLSKINATMADHIVQYAIFGEVKYA
jgi:hypothetical protein